MSRVLVTGATTPIGRQIVRGLARDPAIEHVLAVGAEAEFPLETQLQGKTTYRHVDLTRARDVRNLLFGAAADLGIDSMIHTVLHRSPREHGHRIHALNVESTREMLRAAEEHPTLRRLVFRSCAEVYRVDQHDPSLIVEEHPLALDEPTPQWLRDRIEADLTVCARMGLSKLSIAVLRFAECVAPNSGSQLFDYLQAKRCLQPAGFDPMLNLISVPDVVHALQLSLQSNEQGVFNIPGRDTLPLSRIIGLAGRRRASLPGPLLPSVFRLRNRVAEPFSYDLNAGLLHFGNVLDGRRAKERLGYQPANPIDWSALVTELDHREARA